MEDITNHPNYREARRRVRAVRGFYVHALIYALVNAGLIAINLATSPGRLWFGWGMAGWSVGLAAHGIAVFVFHGRFGRDWEERKIREYLDRKA